MRRINHSTLVLVFCIELFVVVILHVTEVGLFRLFEIWIPSDMGCFDLFNFKGLTVELNTIRSNLVYVHGVVRINFVSLEP